MPSRTLLTLCLALAPCGAAMADCSTGRLAGGWLLTSDLDVACPIAVDAAGAFTATRCRGTGAAYAGRLAADEGCAVDIVLARSDAGRLDTLGGVGRLAADHSRIDGYYFEPGIGAVGFSIVRTFGRDR